MTDQEKKRVVELRHQGYRLTEIAEIVGVNINTIKTFCRKTGLCAVREKVSPVTQFDKNCCPMCGNKFERVVGRKPRRFCSDTCRKVWWKSNTDKLNKQAVYFFTCASCGKSFSAYGNQKRKYCSVKCYRSARFGGSANDK